MWIKWINFNNKCLLFVYVVVFSSHFLTFTKWNAEFCETDCRHSTMLNGNARRTFFCIWNVFLFVFEKFRRSVGVCVCVTILPTAAMTGVLFQSNFVSSFQAENAKKLWIRPKRTKQQQFGSFLLLIKAMTTKRAVQIVMAEMLQSFYTGFFFLWQKNFLYLNERQFFLLLRFS